MANGGVTIGFMAKKTPSRSGGKKPNRKPAYVIYARVRTELGDKVDHFLDTTKPTTTLTGLIELALEEFFARREQHAD